MSIRLIVTHPGSAHKDDFLACSVLAHLHHVPIERREPTDEDLSDPSICVVDVGGRHDPEKSNFDHHQFPREHPPVCALSLVLLDCGLYDDAKRFFSWLQPAEWLDTRGPIETAKRMKIPRRALNELNSPIDVTVLRRFAASERLDDASPIYQVMRMIGEDMVDYVNRLREGIAFLKSNCQFWTLPAGNESVTDETMHAIFLPRCEAMPDDPALGMQPFIESECSDRLIVATVPPDRRGSGYGLSRHEDHPRVDFSRIENAEDVRFAHPRGFVAKTTATDPERLKELLLMAVE